MRDVIRTAILTFNENVTDHITGAANSAQAALNEIQNVLMGSAGKVYAARIQLRPRRRHDLDRRGNIAVQYRV